MRSGTARDPGRRACMRLVQFSQTMMSSRSVLEDPVRKNLVRTDPSFTMSTSRLGLGAQVEEFGFPDRAAALGGWWSQTGSNRRPHACKARALPTELWPRSTPARRQKEAW